MLRHSQPLFDMAGGGGGGKSKADQAKLVFAIVALVAAAVALAWYFGVFSGSPEGRSTTPLDTATEEERQQIQSEFQEQDLQLQQDLDSGRVTESGA